MSTVTIRRVAPADAHGCAAVHIQAWIEAYTGRMPQAILDARKLENYERGWERMLADPDWRFETWVALIDGEIVGFAQAGIAEDPDDAADGRELGAINILAKAYGTGAGQGLFDAAIGTAASGLWVLDDNPRAQTFYRRNGYAFSGREKLDDRSPLGILRELRMTRPVQSA